MVSSVLRHLTNELASQDFHKTLLTLSHVCSNHNRSVGGAGGGIITSAYQSVLRFLSGLRVINVRLSL